jgi:hypothetical protein
MIVSLCVRISKTAYLFLFIRSPRLNIHIQTNDTILDQCSDFCTQRKWNLTNLGGVSVIQHVLQAARTGKTMTLTTCHIWLASTAHNVRSCHEKYHENECYPSFFADNLCPDDSDETGEPNYSNQEELYSTLNMEHQTQLTTDSTGMHDNSIWPTVDLSAVQPTPVCLSPSAPTKYTRAFEKFFRVVPSNQARCLQAECLICQKRFYDKKGRRTNFLRHAKEKHTAYKPRARKRKNTDLLEQNHTQSVAQRPADSRSCCLNHVLSMPESNSNEAIHMLQQQLCAFQEETRIQLKRLYDGQQEINERFRLLFDGQREINDPIGVNEIDFLFN